MTGAGGPARVVVFDRDLIVACALAVEAEAEGAETVAIVTTEADCIDQSVGGAADAVYFDPDRLSAAEALAFVARIQSAGLETRTARRGAGAGQAAAKRERPAPGSRRGGGTPGAPT